MRAEAKEPLRNHNTIQERYVQSLSTLSRQTRKSMTPCPQHMAYSEQGCPLSLALMRNKHSDSFLKLINLL